MDDWELLERFRSLRCHDAFAELVRRHAGFVYATCRRRLGGDAHLAEDVAQAVFLLLSRRPPQRAGSAALAGWLYQTAVYACHNAMRARHTRQRYERDAVEHRKTLVTRSADHQAGAAITVDEVQLDEALSRMSQTDRDALLLRYYQDLDLREVGAALGVSQNTAAKRLSRALERLRRYLVSRGGNSTTLSSVVVADALLRMSHEAAPTALTSKLAAISSGQAAVSLTTEELATGAMQMMKHAQMKLVATVVGVAVAGGVAAAALATLAGRYWSPPNAAMAATAPPNAPAPTAPRSSTGQPAATSAESGPTTPKAAIRAFAAAARAGEAEALKKVVETTDPREQELMLAACDYAGALAAFNKSVADRFGDASAKQLGAGMRLTLLDNFLHSIETQLDELDEHVEGDTARFTYRDADDVIVLVRRNGFWKISATGMTGSWTEQQFGEALGQLKHGAQGLSDLTANVTSGKYATMNELISDLRQVFERGK